ncbi:MAG: hypothetical protein LKE30_06145 [Bacteroidales bacterium]|jgi:superfamily I DNA/RNA helicase|nr:hypothetical protein [Bacteroidales bacterium]
MKKIIISILGIAIVALFGMTFSSCNNDDEKTDNKTIEQKSSNNIADGTYVAYYYLANGEELEIRNIYKDNKLIERTINGQQQVASSFPKQEFFYDKNAQSEAIERSLVLTKEGYPCVDITVNNNFLGKDETVYIVEYSATEPCWYEKYQKK